MDIRTFSFHSHIPDTNKPVECGEVFVNDVLSEIRDIFSGKKTETIYRMEQFAMATSMDS